VLFKNLPRRSLARASWMQHAIRLATVWPRNISDKGKIARLISRESAGGEFRNRK